MFFVCIGVIGDKTSVLFSLFQTFSVHLTIKLQPASSDALQLKINGRLASVNSSLTLKAPYLTRQNLDNFVPNLQDRES